MSDLMSQLINFIKEIFEHLSATQKTIAFGIMIILILGITYKIYAPVEDNTPPASCSVTVQDFSFSPKVVQINGAVQITVNIDNPNGLGVKYNWSVTDGNINPELNAIQPVTTYTAPNYPGNQTIMVKVLPVECEAISYKEQIVVAK